MLLLRQRKRRYPAFYFLPLRQNYQTQMKTKLLITIRTGISYEAERAHITSVLAKNGKANPTEEDVLNAYLNFSVRWTEMEREAHMKALRRSLSLYATLHWGDLCQNIVKDGKNITIVTTLPFSPNNGETEWLKTLRVKTTRQADYKIQTT